MFVILAMLLANQEKIFKVLSTYGHGSHIDNLFQENRFKVLSMHWHGCHIGNLLTGKSFKGLNIYVCMCIVDILAMCFQKKQGFIECMAIVDNVCPCVSRKYVQCISMYGYGCHIGHVFPKNDFHVFFSSMYGHVVI